MRTFLTIIAVLFCTLIGAAVFVISYQPASIEKLALNALKNAGISNFDDIRFHVQDNTLLIRNIELDEQGFTRIEQLKIPFSWMTALSLKPYNMVINGLEISGSLDGLGNFTLSGWDTKKLYNALASLSLDEIKIEDSRMELITPAWGGLVISITGIMTLPSSLDSGHIALKVNSTQRQLAFNANAQGRIFSADQWQLDMDVLDARLDTENLKASRMNGKTTFSHSPGQTYTAEAVIAAGALRVDDYPWQNVELSLYKQGDGSPPSLNGKGQALGQPEIIAGFSMRLGTDYKALNGHIEAPDFQSLNVFLSRGSFGVIKDLPDWLNDYKNPFININQIDENRFQYSLSLKDDNLDISGEALQNNETITADIILAPVLYEHATMPLRAQFGLKGKISLTRNDNGDIKTQTSLPLEITNGLWRQGGIDIENVNGTLNYEDIQTLSMKNGTLSFRWPLDKNIEQKGTVTLSHQWRSEPVIQNLTFDIFGGHFKTDAITDDSFDFNFSSLSLEKLSNALGLESFSASGALKGDFTLKHNEKNIVITKAVFNADGKGVIRYNPSAYPSFLSGNDFELSAMRRALENYNYKTLEIEIAGDLENKWKITLNATGNNPDLFDGRPVAINLVFDIVPGRIFANILRRP